MLVKVNSILLNGIETKPVSVEVSVSSRGLPTFDIVGLAAKSVEESKHRVKAAFQNSDIDFPNIKIVVNLAPADIAKEGSFYDLPIAIGIFAACRSITLPERSLFFGEVSLDGAVRSTKGVFLLSLYAKENGFENIFVPVESVVESGSVAGIKVFGVENLASLSRHLLGEELIEPFDRMTIYENEKSKGGTGCEDDSDISNIIGQEQLKRALGICAAGGHNLIMTGPPGSGKTMSAKALVSILPPLSEPESIEVTKIYSSIGKLPIGKGLIKERPFRNPHHTTSYAGIIGGGNIPSPGEITLAHRGVLFLDELNEFNRNVLEAMRQPLEDGQVKIVRSRGGATFPAKFILVASSNPCPCGYYGDSLHECKCSPKRIQDYEHKLSGPILDRIDLHVNVRPVDKQKLAGFLDRGIKGNENSTQIRQKVLEARSIQSKRFKDTNIYTNSEMSNHQISDHCKLSSEAIVLLNQASTKMGFSARSYFKIIKIARTIADLEGLPEINVNHVAEAIQYRVGA